MKFSIRDLLLVSTVTVLGPILETGVGISSALARPIREWTQQELFDEADVVLVVTAGEPRKTDNSDGFLPEYLQQYESELEVKSVLKVKDEEPAFKKVLDKKTIKFVHFRYRQDSKLPLANGPSFAVMGTTSLANGKPTRPPQYLLYLRRRKDGRYEPVSGNMDPADSIIRLLVFPEHDPALDVGNDRK
jgi:hypothetical protein